MLAHLFEKEALLPFSDTLDMQILHAMLGWTIFNEVRTVHNVSCSG